MTDFNEWDQISADQNSQPWEIASTDLWDSSIGLDRLGDELWIDGNVELANQFYDLSDQTEMYSAEAYQAAWDAWNGPINAEGYTAHDAAMGYTSTDTSFIEPASSAGSMSMIADYSGDSSL
jgi:hypothetical protein